MMRKPRYKNNCSKKVNELHHVTNGLKLFDFTQALETHALLHHGRLLQHLKTINNRFCFYVEFVVPPPPLKIFVT